MKILRCERFSSKSMEADCHAHLYTSIYENGKKVQIKAIYSIKYSWYEVFQILTPTI